MRFTVPLQPAWERRHGAPLAICDEHWNAIGHLNAEQEAWHIGHLAVSLAGLLTGRVGSGRLNN